MSGKSSSRQLVWRINLFVVLVALGAGLIFYQLFRLTYVQHSKFVKSGQFQYNNPAALISGRGDIYASDYGDQKKHLIATNRSFGYVYANTLILESTDSVAEKLAPILKLEKAQIVESLSRKTSYVVLADHLAKELIEKINKLQIKGITAASEVDRYYPNGSFLSGVLGFVGFNGEGRSGQYGIESYYDSVLSGEERTKSLAGNKTYSNIVNFGKSLFGKSETVPSSDGSDVVLTVDYNIQAFVESKLDQTLKKWNAKGGSIIVQDPTNGAILAMTSSPSFDPNRYTAYSLQSFLNKDVQQLFEPGSSFKPITMSGAVDSGSVTPNTTYEDLGAVQFGTFTIRNFDEKARGLQTMSQVLEHSLNTGVIFAENKMGDDKFLNYVIGFGFGQKTGIDLPGEISGNVSNLYSGRKINFATASFGQGIAVTPIQLINAFSAIANDGKLMQPYLVKEIVRADGTKVETKPKVIGQPISDKSSHTMKLMLTNVVEKGYDKARVTGYQLAGKTGTAQIPDANGGYLDNDRFVHNFLGFAPAYSPRFTVLIKMDQPEGIRFAADSLSPVYGDIARFLIRYFNIPPVK